MIAYVIVVLTTLLCGNSATGVSTQIRGGEVSKCAPVDGPGITGRDVAAVNPDLGTLDPTAIIAASPIPGVRRMLRIGSEEMCFERATSPLTAGQLLPVLQSALAIENARIEILDFSRSGVPRGSIEFSRTGLDASGFWRGRVKYDENRSAPVWAKVRVATEQTWVEAIQPLAPGKPIEAGQLVLRRGLRSPLGPAPIGAVEFGVAKTPTRSIKPGEPVFASMLSRPHDVERGETVRVEVWSGEARLSFDAVAGSSARTGETVVLRNPDNGRLFRAKVESRGTAAVRERTSR